jgi:hypothetical protein
MYAILSNNHAQPTGKQKLMTMFELTENDIKQIYKLPFKTTKNCKFQWLSRNLVGSTYGRFYIKFPQSRMKGERHRLSPLSL